MEPKTTIRRMLSGNFISEPKYQRAYSCDKEKQVKRFINKLSKVITWANEHALIRYVLVFLTIAYVLATYKTQFMAWYDNNIIPILGYFISNIWLGLLSFILCIVAIYDIVRRVKVHYQYDKRIVLILFFVSVVLVYCRLSGDYDYVNWIWSISYVDVIIVFCIAHAVAAIVNKFRMLYNLCNNKDGKTANPKDSILNDWPIECKEEDIFDIEDEAAELAKKIKALDRKKTWSLAITAPWGTGKTSFLNLILEYISERDFEVVRFIPRDSKSYKTIQEDFFNSIACVLSKYDSRCSNTLKDYMASLQLIDNRRIVERVANIYRIWNKDNLKDSIKESFASLDKKILVLIDDFDRLSKDEILEVLKLIDSNAAFTNLVFLTAYDKEQVNKSLGDSYMTKDACFVDKFFNLEFSIPSRPYSDISRYIENKLCEFLNVNESEKKDIQQTITNRGSIFEEYIPTLRDAKRFINQLVLDFEQVRGDVIIDEFLLVKLIKYRYPELYRSLYKKEYTDTQGKYLLFDYKYIIYLKEKLDENLKILPILKLLFPKDNNADSNFYKHIYDTRSFDNYFVNQIYSSLRIRDMQALFSLEWNDVTCILDEWISNDKKSKDFMDYLNNSNMDDFSNNTFWRYAEMVAYLACKLPDSRAYWMFLRLIYNENLKDYDKKYKLNPESYKERLLDIVKNNDSKLQLITRIHYMYKTLKLNEEEVLIKDDDIWPFIKEKFIQTANLSSVNEDELQEWLYQCIDSMEKTSTILILDRTCLDAYRKRVEENPSYYIKTFVRLGMVSSNPDWNTIIDCESYWEQIFGNKEQFEDFLSQCKDKKIEKFDLVWNFWQLYKANDFKPISFENQGSVQEIINNNLAEEVKKLEKMKQLEKDLSQIPDNIDSISDDNKTEYKQKLLKCKKELDDINLYISLNGQIKKSIEEKLEKIKV